MLRSFATLCALALASSVAMADDDAATSGSSGEAKSETTYKPAIKLNDHSSIGGYGNSTTTGGYTTGGSGQAIPDGSAGSRQDSSKGIMYEYKF
jgi:hypothetical protein